MKRFRPITSLSSAALLAGVCLALACADPIIQYHRQFDYLTRVGAEALEEERYAAARKHLFEASRIAGFAAATDLEIISAFTQLTRACRELGQLEEAVSYANRASQILARYRLGHGGMSSGVYRVGAAYLLERGALEVARGDLTTAEAVLDDFVRVRGEDGGDAVESAAAQLLLGELRLARGFDAEARALFRASLDSARGSEDRALTGFALYRVAEEKLARGRGGAATELVEESRGDGVVTAQLAPGLLLMRALIDVNRGDRERAGVRLEEALGLLESGEPAFEREIAAPSRAIVLAGLLFGGSAADPGRAAALERAVRRALEVARKGSSLRSVQAGRAAVAVGGSSIEGGAVDAGISMMVAGRLAIAEGMANRVHDAGVMADFEIASALEQRGRLDAAARPCARLVDATDRVSLAARDLHPERLLVCGRIGAANRDASGARKAFGRALMVIEEAGGTPVLQMELLLRLAALAHEEGRDAEEGKLFDRVLAFVLPGVYEHLEKMLVGAYSPYGRYQPSSAAARLGHAAARSYAYAVEAPQLQALAEKLGEAPAPASRP